MARRDWIRVRSRWWTDPDHAGLSFGAKAIGPFLFWLADGDPTWRETGQGRLLGPSGAALGPEDVARMAGARLREVRRWVAELVAVGTILRSDDGVLYFPNYRTHQEDPSAKRVRAHRARNVTVTPDVTGEVEAEAEEEQRQKEESFAAPKRRATRPSLALSSDACEVAQYLYDAIRSHTPAFMADAKPATIESKLERWAKDIDVGLRNDGMTVEGCRAATDAAHRSEDDFWRSNLLSGKKLRQHYEKLKIRSNGRGSSAVEQMKGFDYHAFGERLDGLCVTKK